MLVLGATGATGHHFLRAATESEHEVVALVRDPSRLPERCHPEIVIGDARDADCLEPAMRGVDAVVSLLGMGIQRHPAGLFEGSSQAIVTAASRTDVRRLVVMSSFGVGRSLDRASLLMRLLYRPGAAVFADKEAGEKLIEAADLEWTLVYPVALTNGTERGSTAAVDLAHLTRLRGIPRVARADVARFLLDTVERATWVRRTVVVHQAGRGRLS